MIETWGHWTEMVKISVTHSCESFLPFCHSPQANVEKIARSLCAQRYRRKILMKRTIFLLCSSHARERPTKVTHSEWVSSYYSSDFNVGLKFNNSWIGFLLPCVYFFAVCFIDDGDKGPLNDYSDCNNY